MFRIAYCAGHGRNTAGKRLPKTLDPNQTREWVLNDRVADHFAKAALEYEGVMILRTDDSTGSKDVPIKTRVANAAAWDADVYVDMHHNAGIALGTGGGVVSFSYPGNARGKAYRDAVYDAVIAAGGLKGNRAAPKQEKNYETLRRCHKAGIPGVLMEYGFMDSRTDAPVILAEAYAELVAYATMAGIAKVAGLKKKAAIPDKPAINQSEVCTVEIKVLKKGAKGATVKAMQTLLIGDGFSCGEKGADGSFGGDTDKALRAYQKAAGLEPDGSCGPATWASLLGV